MNCIKKITIQNYPKNNTPIINVLDNSMSYLLIDEWPMAQNYFTDDEIDRFEQIISGIVDAKVIQEDRDRFTLMTNDVQKIERLQLYLEEKSKNFLVGNSQVSTVRKNLKVKEINALIQEQTEDFFKNEGMKFVKTNLAYVQNNKESRAEYGFGYYEYHPQYDYYILLFVRLKEVEKIYGKIDGTGLSGYTYIFRLSYFLDKSNLINNNPTWSIRGEEGIGEFSQALMDNYTTYFKEFIPFITQPENMLEFLLNDIATGKVDRHIFVRSLILMKILDYPMGEIETKLAEMKAKLVNCCEDIKQEIYKQLDDVVSGNWI